MAKISIKTIVLINFLLISNFLFSQKYVLKGYVEDEDTQERLIGALLKVEDYYTSSNTYGFYSLSIPKKDTTIISINCLGYEEFNIDIQLNKDTVIVFKLKKKSHDLGEIIITSDLISNSLTNGSISLSTSVLRLAPKLGAEVDVMKNIQMLPGVTQSTEGKSDLIVQGGSSDQNLIIFDDAPVYYINHIGGFVSIFNIDMIKNVQLYKGYFPAEFGDRLSSVIDIQTIDGNMTEFKHSITLSPVSSSFFIEGPVIKDKMSFVFSLRRSFIDVFIFPVSYFSKNDEKTLFSFYDFNFKLSYRFLNNSKLYLSFYKGSDVLKNSYFNTNENLFGYDFKKEIGNTLGSFRWNTKIFKKSFFESVFSITKFNYSNSTSAINISNSDTVNYYRNSFNSNILDFNFNNKIVFSPLNFYKATIGLNGVIHNFSPANVVFLEQGASNIFDTTVAIKDINYELNYFLDNSINFNNNLILNLGLRYSIKFLKKNYVFNTIEPRINVNFLIENFALIKISYQKSTQPVHYISFNDFGAESALWLPATRFAPPELSEQFSFNSSFNFYNKFKIELGLYYKKMNNLISLKNGSVLNNVINWEENCIKEGTGKSYGFEFFIVKNKGKINGWLAYTLSKTIRQFDEINFGREYPYDFDRPHDLKFFFNYKITQRIDLSLYWIFTSGKPITLPMSFYQTINYYNENEFSFNSIEYFSEKNSYRMKPYHRLDLSLNFSKVKKNKTRIWSLNLYNAYNRLNPYYYYYETTVVNNTKVRKLYQFTLFPIIPSISYSLKF